MSVARQFRRISDDQSTSLRQLLNAERPRPIDLLHLIRKPSSQRADPWRHNSIERFSLMRRRRPSSLGEAPFLISAMTCCGESEGPRANTLALRFHRIRSSQSRRRRLLVQVDFSTLRRKNEVADATDATRGHRSTVRALSAAGYLSNNEGRRAELYACQEHLLPAP